MKEKVNVEIDRECIMDAAGKLNQKKPGDGQLRDHGGPESFPSLNSGHPIKPMLHREILFKVISETDGADKLKKIKNVLNKVDR